jgi:aspartate/methionine/tyrosine aminotransferase
VHFRNKHRNEAGGILQLRAADSRAADMTLMMVERPAVDKVVEEQVIENPATDKQARDGRATDSRVLERQPDALHISGRAANIAPFIAMDVMAIAKQRETAGENIVHMEVGEPGAPPPRLVREAAMAALGGGPIGYTESSGRPSLRARIARHYRDAYGVGIDADRIVVTTGSSGGFLVAFLALFDVGARVAIANPGYPAYRNIFDAFGIEPVLLDTNAAGRFAVTAAMIEEAHRHKKLDGVLLMSPANPSGTMFQPDALRDICGTCARLSIPFISDEIYHGLTYAGPAQTALRYSDAAIVVNSFSKYYCMTGWRVGWLVLPRHLVRPVERLQQSMAVAAPTLSQIGAEAAFDALDALEAVKAGYARSRAILFEELPRIGLANFHPADGAFYLYVDVSRYTNDSTDFCKRMLGEAGVAATPGLDFDRDGGNRTVRFSFSGSEATIVEGVKRLGTWLR